MGVRARLVSLFALLVGVGLVGFMALWSFGIPLLGVEGMVAQEIRRSTLSTEVLADKARDSYERWFAEHRRALTTWSQSPELARMVAMPATAAQKAAVREALERRLAVLKELNPGSLRSLYLVASDGQTLLANDGSQGRRADPGHAESVAEALAPGAVEVVHLLPDAPGGAGILVVQQVVQRDRWDQPTGRILGALVAELALDVVLVNDAQSIAQSLGESGAVLLADAAGTVLLDSSALASSARNRFVARQLVAGSESSRVIRSPDGEEVIATFRHLHLGGADTLSMIVIRTTQDGLQSIRASILRIGVLALVMACLALVLLVSAANRVAAAQVEILALNAGLEGRIAARTHELEETNANLRETLAALSRAQAELVRTEKLAALGSLVAGVSHELNTPLGNSLMAASTMEDQNRFMEARLREGLKRSDLDGYLAQMREGVSILMNSLRRAVDLVQSFKQVAVDQTSEQRRLFLLGQTIDDILMTLGPSIRKSGHRVEAQVPGGIRLDSYPGPLGQILTNLVTNALVHAFSERSRGLVAIRAERLGADMVRIEVRDDGVGIVPEHLGRVFDPFFTTRLGQGGSGLGLNIVYNLTHDVLGGSVSVDSEAGKGTCFTLVIPLSAPRREAPP